MSGDESERLLNDIAILLLESADQPMNDMLLIAKLDYGYVSPSVFADRGNVILYSVPEFDRLCTLLLDLWEVQQTEPRWAEMEYLIHDGRFHVTYTYPDEIDPDEFMSLDRRAAIVERYFGPKPVRYPPPPTMQEDGSYRF